MKKQTVSTKQSEIKRSWHVIDVKGQILGRSATNIANLLMGKSKSYFVKHLDCGDYVVVINAKEVKTTGNKEKAKVYTRYSGYPGGLRKETLEKLRLRKPEEIIRHAVSGMLPHTRLHDRMLKRLYVFADDKHPYDAKLKSENSNGKSEESKSDRKESV